MKSSTHLPVVQLQGILKRFSDILDSLRVALTFHLSLAQYKFREHKRTIRLFLA